MINTGAKIGTLFELNKKPQYIGLTVLFKHGPLFWLSLQRS